MRMELKIVASFQLIQELWTRYLKPHSSSRGARSDDKRGANVVEHVEIGPNITCMARSWTYRRD